MRNGSPMMPTNQKRSILAHEFKFFSASDRSLVHNFSYKLGQCTRDCLPANCTVNWDRALHSIIHSIIHFIWKPTDFCPDTPKPALSLWRTPVQMWTMKISHQTASQVFWYVCILSWPGSFFLRLQVRPWSSKGIDSSRESDLYLEEKVVFQQKT